MSPELNREYPELDDPKLFQHMIDLILGQMKPIEDHLRRGQHAKTTGCVIAEFQIADEVPANLRHGVFQQPGRTFNAIVRFSNSSEKFEKDKVGTARGIAIKLLEIGGTRAVSDDGDNSQDFLMINFPVFPFPNPKAYVDAISRKSIPLIGEALLFAHLLISEPKELKIVNGIRHNRVASPLEINYFSAAPFWLGPANGEAGHAIKYSAVSCQHSRTPLPDNLGSLPDDYLTNALASGLQFKESTFDFKVQLQTDPVDMPVENVSVEWDESVSEPIKVATLRIPPQGVERFNDLAMSCESMSFTPWHALAEHRPMGGMNRLRKVVYQASIAKRTPHLKDS
jgi:hypothetical protein